jgi:hypothetical protein
MCRGKQNNADRLRLLAKAPRTGEIIGPNLLRKQLWWLVQDESKLLRKNVKFAAGGTGHRRQIESWLTIGVFLAKNFILFLFLFFLSCSLSSAS